jgi:hypothetical protein
MESRPWRKTTWKIITDFTHISRIRIRNAEYHEDCEKWNKCNYRARAHLTATVSQDVNKSIMRKERLSETEPFDGVCPPLRVNSPSLRTTIVAKVSSHSTMVFDGIRTPPRKAGIYRGPTPLGVRPDLCSCPSKPAIHGHLFPSFLSPARE